MTTLTSSAAASHHTPRAGYTLLELLLVVAVCGVIVSFAAPPLLRSSLALRTDLAAQELVGVLRLCRQEAAKRGANVGVKFDTSGDTVSFRLHRDGDGDGVSSADIATGTDPAVGPARPLAHVGGEIGFGFPAGRPPRDPGNPRRRLDRLDDPIRFNLSDIASFGPLGQATPGTLYITDGRDQLVAVRVNNRTGRVRILRWRASVDRWADR